MAASYGHADRWSCLQAVPRPVRRQFLSMRRMCGRADDTAVGQAPRRVLSQAFATKQELHYGCRWRAATASEGFVLCLGDLRRELSGQRPDRRDQYLIWRLSGAIIARVWVVRRGHFVCLL